jgi:hypothetical protein
VLYRVVLTGAVVHCVVVRANRGPEFLENWYITDANDVDEGVNKCSGQMQKGG